LEQAPKRPRFWERGGPVWGVVTSCDCDSRALAILGVLVLGIISDVVNSER